jgi:hypothetical protein
LSIITLISLRIFIYIIAFKIIRIKFPKVGTRKILRKSLIYFFFKYNNSIMI